MPPDGEPNMSSTPRTQGTMVSANGTARVQANDYEASIEAAALLINVARDQPHPNQVEKGEEVQKGEKNEEEANKAEEKDAENEFAPF